MQGHDIIVIGASAGGVEALSQLVQGLPPGLPAALFVVCHFPSERRSFLPDILSRQGKLLAEHPQDGAPIQAGHIYVAPPDYHLILHPGRVQLSHGPRENNHRPAIDPLFRSAARVYGKRVIGVILSGWLNDGVAGLLAIRAVGGLAVVQDPTEIMAGSMPREAWEVAGADYVVPLAKMAPLLVKMVQDPAAVQGEALMPDPLEQMPQRVNDDMEAQEEGGRRGELSVYTCPECGGCLWQVNEETVTRFRCHVGHVYYAESLFEEQAQALEAALWTAVRIFKEKTILSRQLAATERQRGNQMAAQSFDEAAAVAERNGRVIQESLLSGLPEGNGRMEPGTQPRPLAEGEAAGAEE